MKKETNSTLPGQELTQEMSDLQTALSDLKKITTITTICSFCKKVRNRDGQWAALSANNNAITPETLLSHGFCPTCARKNFPDEYEAVLKKKPTIYVPTPLA